MTDVATYTFINRNQCPACDDVENQNFYGRRSSKRGGLRPWQVVSLDIPIIRCCACELIYSNPLPIPASISQHYGVTPQEYWPDDYFKPDELTIQIESNAIESIISSKKVIQFLDIGAGIGKTMKQMAIRGWETWGIEPGEQFYNAAIVKNGIPRERLQLSSIEEAQFENDFFDVISFGAVLEHLYKPFKCLEKSLNWLKPGGIIHIEVPSSNWLMSKGYRRIQKLMGSQYVINLSPMHNPFHLHEFSHKTFEKLTFAHQFEIARHQYWPCHTYLPSGLSWLATKYMQLTDSGMQLVIYLRKKS
jgi:2-polyprenyl-3-methyl-5-hydroxy-6-metoxy-1,4-benzoquinol methylase